jgi:hypothetical protein
MSYIDNMGGFISAQFVLEREVYSFEEKPNGCIVTLLPGKSWKKLNFKQFGVSLQVAPERTDAGLQYNISGAVELRKDDENISALQSAECILFAFTNTDHITQVVGTKDHPLTVTLAPITPSEPAGFVGYAIDFTGSQLIPVSKLANR